MSAMPEIQIDSNLIDIPQFTDPDYDLNTSQLRAWNSLSEGDYNHLHSSMESIQQQSVFYDEQIEKMRAYLRFAEAQKSIAARSFQRKSSLLSPIRKLPLEMLEHIFALYCHKKAASGSLDWVSKGLKVPYLTLSHTCALWREIASRVWPVINLVVNVNTPTMVLDILSKHLSVLPKDIPLEITVCCDLVTSVAYESINGRKAFDMLLDRAGQWESAELVMDIQPLKWLCERRPLSFEKLETMKLSILSGTDAEIKECSKVFQSATHLRTLSIHDNDPDDLDLPFSNLTSLSLEPKESDELKILDHCSNLQTLHLKFESLDGEDDPPSHSVYFTSNITHLVLSYIAWMDDLYLLDFLHLPHLETLDIEATPEKASRIKELDLEPLVSMLSRSGSPLRRLSLIGPIKVLDYAAMLDVFAAAPSINHLGISFFPREPHASSLFNRLTVVNPRDPASNTLLPVLSKLEISVWRGSLFADVVNQSLGSICDFLESRVAVSEGSEIVPLKSFGMVLQTGSYSDIPETTRRLKALARTAGINISLETASSGSAWWTFETEKFDIFADEE
jgi:hypothetical protein